MRTLHSLKNQTNDKNVKFFTQNRLSKAMDHVNFQI